MIPFPLEQRDPHRDNEGPLGGAEPNDASEVQAEDEREHAKAPRLVCAACGRFVTSRAEAIEVADHHEHTFVNPAGFVYKIGCFAEAFCRAEGPASSNWSWFPGYHWQAVLCTSCGVQLGWLFRSTPHTFYGLVLERLAEASGEES
ncbi:MAG: hypothetical protein JRH20_23735 [Deltaproteobacteria bacterium]|nr:hypothetical protein [Deltaproteobacteria bacterium]